MTAYTRTQIGNVLTESDGTGLLVYVHQYADEEPDAIQISGHACDVVFDPSSPRSRQQVLDLCARLAEAITFHQRRCEQLYGDVQVGDWCPEIREPIDDEPQCAYVFNGPIARPRCSRVEHADGHHVAVDDNYQVIAVTHPRPIMYVDEAPRAFGMPAAELFEQMMRSGRKSWTP